LKVKKQEHLFWSGDALVRYQEVYCKSILNKSGIPGVDFALNPYTGCEHSCVYCYAVFMKRFTNHPEKWGGFVDIKINAPEVLHRQLKSLKSRVHISIGTVCDAYQPIEERFKITRRCLEVLKYYDHSLSILTKSPLVLRDIDLLLKIKEIEIGFTTVTLNPKIKELFEPNSPPVKERLSALKNLSENGIPTWVFVAPVIPFLTDNESDIKELIESAQEAGAKNITFDSLNPYPKVWNRVMEIIRREYPELVKKYQYYFHNKPKYEVELKERISKISPGARIEVNCVF